MVGEEPGFIGQDLGIMIGSTGSLGFVWDLTDTLNGCMMIPNLIGLLFLSPEIVKLKKEWFANELNKDKNRNPEGKLLAVD